jgi:hypothetical protein
MPDANFTEKNRSRFIFSLVCRFDERIEEKSAQLRLVCFPIGRRAGQFLMILRCARHGTVHVLFHCDNLTKLQIEDIFQ